MTQRNPFRNPKNGFVCLLPFVLFIPNITFKHTQFRVKTNLYKILRGVDSYGFMTLCIGNMSSHLHRYILSINVIELFEWQQQHHYLQNIF